MWREIFSIHAVVALRCREAFGDPIRLGVAISSYDDAVEIIEECVGESVAEHVINIFPYALYSYFARAVL